MRPALYVVLISALFLAACSDDAEKCADCLGCCDTEGTCHGGLSVSFCGTGGGTCNACGRGEVCDEGSCKAAPIECDNGCTVPGTSTCMIPGVDNAACGPLGGECVNCAADEKICDTNTRVCVDRPAECDAAVAFSCKTVNSYCDATGVCRSCPGTTYNCNGDNGDECESATICGDPPTCASETTDWPQDAVAASFNLPSNLTQGEMRLGTQEPYALLRVEDWHEDTGYPKTVTFSSNTKLSTPRCDVCVFIATGCEGYSPGAENYYTCMGKLFFAQKGTAVIEQADVQASPGALKVTLTDLELVEWDEDGDVPVANGDCWTVGSAVLDASW